MSTLTDLLDKVIRDMQGLDVSREERMAKADQMAEASADLKVSAQINHTIASFQYAATILEINASEQLADAMIYGIMIGRELQRRISASVPTQEESTGASTTEAAPHRCKPASARQQQKKEPQL